MKNGLTETLANIFTISALGSVLLKISLMLTIVLTCTGICLNILGIREKIRNDKRERQKQKEIETKTT
jgi:preprotein translocase subunit SecG